MRAGTEAHESSFHKASGRPPEAGAWLSNRTKVRPAGEQVHGLPLRKTGKQNGSVRIRANMSRQWCRPWGTDRTDAYNTNSRDSSICDIYIKPQTIALVARFALTFRQSSVQSHSWPSGHDPQAHWTTRRLYESDGLTELELNIDQGLSPSPVGGWLGAKHVLLTTCEHVCRSTTEKAPAVGVDLTRRQGAEAGECTQKASHEQLCLRVMSNEAAMMGSAHW